jgi:hypothetical protein
MDHLPLVNEAYAKFFTEDPKPVRILSLSSNHPN